MGDHNEENHHDKYGGGGDYDVVDGDDEQMLLMAGRVILFSKITLLQFVSGWITRCNNRDNIFNAMTRTLFGIVDCGLCKSHGEKPASSS